MIVQDRLDPSGMFSKAGRLSLEMYSMLQEKEFILSGKRKSSKHNNIPPHPVADSNTSTNIAQKNQHQRGIQSTKPQSNCNQPFFKIVSRDKHEELQQKMVINNQKFGMYNPKFHLLFEKSSLYPDMESEENKQRARDFQQKVLHFSNQKKTRNIGKKVSPGGSLDVSKLILPQHQTGALNQSLVVSGGKVLNQSISDSSLLGIDYDKPRKHIACPVPLEKQCARKPLLNPTSPHEKRFEFIEMPQIYSKSRHLPNISFDTQKREATLFGSKTGGLDYNVNYDSVLPRVSIGVLDYSKQTPRKSEDKPIYTLNEKLANESYFAMGSQNSVIHTKVTSPTFKKMAGRDNSIIHDSKLVEYGNESQHTSQLRF